MSKLPTFKNEEEKRNAYTLALKGLDQDLGWRIIKKILKDRVALIEQKLYGEREFGKDETQEELQKQSKDRKYLLELPNELIEEMKETKNYPIDNFDPYE